MPTTDGDQFRLVVRSIGSAGVKWIDVLSRLRPAPDAELARLLFQAPSELLSNVPLDEGEQLVELLSSSGLEVELVSADEPFQPGVGEYDVALFVNDISQLPQVIAGVVEVVGAQVEEARRLLFNQPPVVLGQVSTATVAALRQRFEPLGVDVVASRLDEARFDVYLATESDTVRRRAAERLHSVGAEVVEVGEVGQRDGLLAMGLDAEAADDVWQSMGQRTEGLKIVDQAFERYDVVLESLPDSSEAADCLVELTGMPAELVARVRGSLPVVVAQDLGADEMVDMLRSLAEVGADAVSELTTFQRFDLALPDAIVPSTAKALGSLGLEATETENGPMIELRASRTAAEWVAIVLDRAGASTELVPA